MSQQPLQPVSTSAESNNIALLVWIGSIFLGWIVPLLVYLLKKDDEFVQAVSKEALNWSITAFVAFIVAWALMFVLIGFIVLPVVVVANLVFCILGAVKASKGEVYWLPFNIRLIK